MKTFHLFIFILLGTVSCSKDDPSISDNTVANFPDPVFNAFCLTHYDLNGDGKITVSEIKDVTELIIQDERIESLAGIEFFVNLETLDCSLEEGTTDVGLRELDVSRNSKLKELSCYYHRLEKLNIRGLKKLYLFGCTHNKLKELDLRGLPELGLMDCSDNELTELDFSECPKLWIVGCEDNRITHLDLRKYGYNLEHIMCSGNPGLRIDLKWDQAIYLFHDEDCVVNIEGDSDLEFSEPYIEAQLAVRFDDNGDGRISRHEALLIGDLFDLECSNVATLADLNYLTRLRSCRIWCRNKEACNLTSLNTIAGNETFEYMDIDNFPITSVNLSRYPNLTHVVIRRCDIEELDLSQLQHLNVLYCRENPKLKSVIFKDRKQKESFEEIIIDEHILIKYKLK